MADLRKVHLTAPMVYEKCIFKYIQKLFLTAEDNVY